MQVYSVERVHAQGSTTTCPDLLKLLTMYFIHVTNFCLGHVARLHRAPSLSDTTSSSSGDTCVFYSSHSSTMDKSLELPMALVVDLIQDVLPVCPGPPKGNSMLHHISVVDFTRSRILVVGPSRLSVVPAGQTPQ